MKAARSAGWWKESENPFRSGRCAVVVLGFAAFCIGMFLPIASVV